MMKDLITKWAIKWVERRRRERIHADVASGKYSLAKIEQVRWDPRDGSATITMAHKNIAGIASDAAQLLIENDAENFVQFVMWPEPKGDRLLPPVRVTVQWEGKFSPMEKIGDLENKLRNAIRQYQSLMQQNELLRLELEAGQGDLEASRNLHATVEGMKGMDRRGSAPFYLPRLDDEFAGNGRTDDNG